MNWTKYAPVREWINAWKAVFSVKWYLPLSATLDIAFFVLYGFMTSPLLSLLSDHTVAIGMLVSGQLRAAEGGARPAVVSVLFHPPVSKYVMQFIILLVVLVLAVFLLYCVLQGFAWRAAGMLSGLKMHWRAFLLHFARVNILWFALYSLWHFAALALELRGIFIGAGRTQPGAVMYVLLGLVAYFAVVSYPLLSIRNAFVSGIRNAFVFVPAAAVVLAQFFAGNSVLKVVSVGGRIVLLIAGAIILLVLLAWSRAYIAFVARGAKNV